MKRSMKALSLTLLGACLPLFASSWNSCCNFDGCWEIGAEAIYWKPCICEWEYGTTTSVGFNSEEITEMRSVNPDYDWGFRIFGGYTSADCCNFLTLDWTYLRTTDVASEAAVLNFSNLTNTKARLRFRYNRVNLRGGYYLHRGCNMDFYAYAGIRYVEFDQRRQLFSNDALRSREKSRLSAGALEFGVGGLYRLNCGINIVGNVGPLAGIGEREHSFISNDLDGAPSKAIYPDRTICFPGLDFRIGLNTTYECDCFTLVGEIGYELNYYYQALTTFAAYGSTNSSDDKFSTCQNIGFAGPYASLTVRF